MGVMLEALQREMPEGVSWTKPEGGMFVWLTLPRHMDGAKLLEYALEYQKLAFVPGQAFFPDGKEPKFVNAVLDHMAREARPEAF